MKIIDRYIVSTIIVTTAMIFLVFLGMHLLINLLGEMNHINQGAYGIWQVFQHALLMLPLNMYSLFPSIALLGTLLGLGSLASSSELTVMRTSGMSIFRLSFSVLWSALILIVLATFMGEFLAPPMASLAEKNKAFARSNGQVLSTETGIWLRQNKMFIHIGVNYGDNHLSDITRYELNDDFQLVAISHADSGDLQNKQWQMKNVTISQITSERVTTIFQPEATWNFNVALGNIGKLGPVEMSLPQVYKQAVFRIVNGISVENFLLSFWERAFQPLTTLVMVFLAIPFVFGPLRSVTAGLRIITGVMIGLGFYIFNRFFGPFSVVYQLPAILSALIPIGIFGFIALILLLRKQ